MPIPVSTDEYTHDRSAFAGFKRDDGHVGVRNRVLVTPSVICSHIVAERIAAVHESAICTPHDHGCGQIGADHEQTERTLLNLSRNPNIAGAVVVGLGCEHLQSAPFAGRIAAAGVPVRETSIQDAGGTEACIDEGVELTADIAEITTSNQRRTDATLSELTVGVVSSDLHRSTREVADPLVGETVDALIDAGARVVIAGTERLASNVEASSARGATDMIASQIREAGKLGTHQPGNARRVVQRAMSTDFESVVGTWGGASVDEFIPYGSRATIDNGLTLVDSSSRFEEAATALAAAGVSIIIHVTADGIPTGHPVVPVLKLTGDQATAKALKTDLDLNARRADREDVLAKLARTAGGAQSATEKHGLTKFAVSRVGPSL